MKAFLLALAGLLALAVAILRVLANGFAREIARAEARLAGAPSDARAGALRRDLPPRVRAFAERGLAGGRPGVAVRLTQDAEMRLKRGAGWTALTARQVIASSAPGFAWVAEMKRGPLVAVRVIDSFIAGDGRLEVRALGAFRMGLETGPDAALGEALRYLAELPWAPDAILTNQAIAWAATPEGVTARIETSGGPAVVLFSFDAAGDIVAVRAEDRPATLSDGTPVRLAWLGRFEDYAQIGGRRIPRAGEVGYAYPDGYESYWRGRITGLEVVAE